MARVEFPTAMVYGAATFFGTAPYLDQSDTSGARYGVGNSDADGSTAVVGVSETAVLDPEQPITLVLAYRTEGSV